MIARRGASAIQIDPSVASAYKAAGWHVTAESGDLDAPADETTVTDLQDRAKALDIKGRSSMNKDDLLVAVAEAEATGD